MERALACAERPWRSRARPCSPSRGLCREPQRHYHTLQHLSECLAEFAAVRPLAQNPAAIEIALWFHDAVYYPHASDNEEHSASLATTCLTDAAVSGAFIATVRELILATRHQHGGQMGDPALLADIDLAILGQPSARFWQYENDIRREYAWVPSHLYAEKRGEFLAAFLNRPTLYATDFFRAKYEHRARSNLAESLRRLQANRPS
jgi:predicted metal-dependent HD superfamily phosphohydrolase